MSQALGADPSVLADEQAALRRVAMLVARGVGPAEIFSAVSREVARLFSSEAAVARFEPDGSGMVVVGLSEGIPGRVVAIGTRWDLEEFLASTAVYRTGRPARNEKSGWEHASGPIADSLRDMGFVSTVAVPIVVEGNLWGVMTVSDAHQCLPPDMEVRLANFTELVATAIANAESRAELAASEGRAQNLAREQASLRRVATLVARGAKADEVFSAVAQEVGRVFDVPMVTVCRYESDAILVLSSVGAPEFPADSRWPLGLPSLPASIYETGRSVRIDDYTCALGLDAIARDAGVKAGVGVPIVVDGEVWGSINIATPDSAPFAADAEERLAGFAELVSTAIANVAARDQLRSLLDEQAALRRVATLIARGARPGEVFSAVSDEVARLFGSEEAAVARFEPDGSGVVVLGVSDGIQGVSVGTRWELEDFMASTAVYRTGRPARKDRSDWEGASGPIAETICEVGFVSTAAVPIVVEGNLWGVMVVSDAHKSLPVGSEERLESFTELVATAIANAKSRAELAASEAFARGLAREQAALRRVATLVAQGARDDQLFSAVAREVAGVIDIPVVGVHRYESDATFTVLGIAGETGFTVGRRWPVEDEGLAGRVLATGRPARKDDYATMPGPLGRAVRDDRLVSIVGVPIVVDGSIWGFIVAGGRPGAPVPADTEERLARFTELVATAVSNATTRADLLASRARVVSAADETRRRLERDLHDGIQQWLVALALRARRAAADSAPGASPGEELSRIADDLVTVIDEVREISRGIHPAILSRQGLANALKVLARRSAVPVELDVHFEGRYDASLEATVYYVAAESITNAAKHAQPCLFSVRGGVRDGAIEIEIKDDGVGGAEPSRGSGIIGLKDRVDALGGTFSVSSPVGAGTTIRVRLPATDVIGRFDPGRGTS